MTDTPTTALTIYDCASDPSSLTTGADPVTVPLGPRLYRVTTGGTAGPESIVLPMPDLPLAGFANDELIGLRISISLATRTDPADVVVITPADGNFSVLSPLGLGVPQMESVSLTYLGGGASFVWAYDAWALDASMTDANFNNVPAAGQQTGLAGQTGSDGNGGSVVISGATGLGTGNGGDISIVLGIVTGSGVPGALRINGLPTSDPADTGALWDDGGLPLLSGTDLASRMVVYFASLPTSDPVDAGKPWLNSGVLNVSAG